MLQSKEHGKHSIEGPITVKQLIEFLGEVEDKEKLVVMNYKDLAFSSIDWVREGNKAVLLFDMKESDRMPEHIL